MRGRPTVTADASPKNPLAVRHAVELLRSVTLRRGVLTNVGLRLAAAMVLVVMGGTELFAQTAGAPTTGNRQTFLSAEDLRLGAFKAPPRPFPFPLLGDDKAREIYVDRLGKIYKERPYKGLVPNWNKRRTSLRKRCKVVPQALTWIGFQNNIDSSRVFIQVDQAACGYVYRPDDHHIVIDLPAVRVVNPNLRRDILTGAFPTPVNLVHVEEVKGKGTRVTIALKGRQRYLSAHLGRYVFVDVAR
jgi:hypothetical protein